MYCTVNRQCLLRPVKFNLETLAETLASEVIIPDVSYPICISHKKWGPEISGARNIYFCLPRLMKPRANLCRLLLWWHFLMSEKEREWKGEKSLLLSRTEPRFLGHPACRRIAKLPNISRLQKKQTILFWCFSECCYGKLNISAHYGKDT
jgi:hypothetical protein